MATDQRNLTFRCPGCAGVVTFEGQSWQCSECGHAVAHSAD